MPPQTRRGSQRPRRGRERDRQRAARTQGLRSASIVTRIALAASVALSVGFSAIAAVAFPGRASHSDGNRTNASTDRSRPVVALPPANGGSGGVPAPPIQVPAPSSGAGQASSGGS